MIFESEQSVKNYTKETGIETGTDRHSTCEFYLQYAFNGIALNTTTLGQVHSPSIQVNFTEAGSHKGPPQHHHFYVP